MVSFGWNSLLSFVNVIASSDNQVKQNVLDPFIELYDIIEDEIVNKLRKIALKTHNIAHEVPESREFLGQTDQILLETLKSKEII